ncbi:MAG: Transcriptional regulatory protein sin3 [Chrysothrix sp. TS-e1954]|nr:MAG: Transcriptional regulatory protein sin3 [Chrysothrix sp. TS-e1954]
MDPTQIRDGWQQPSNLGQTPMPRPSEQDQRAMGPQQYGYVQQQKGIHEVVASLKLPERVIITDFLFLIAMSLRPIVKFRCLDQSYLLHQNGPSLPAISGMTQPPHGVAQHHHPLPHMEQNQSSHAQNSQAQPVHPQPTHHLPSINQAPSNAMQGHMSYEQERQMREVHDREQFEAARREQQQREQDARDREVRDRQQQLTPQPQSSEPMQLHQPVAVGPQMRTAIHGPNGLLNSGQGSNAPVTTGQVTQGISLFAPPPYQERPQQGPGGAPPPPPSQVSAQHTLPFSTTPGMHQMSSAGGPGQQPILNDALSYLDQVKVQFTGEPNVYNQFLDIMKDFKSQAIDTPGVIRRVSQLFQGNPNLIQGFNTFLPPGYKIECGTDDDPNAIRVTTPMGTTVSPMGTALPPPRGHVQPEPDDGASFDSGVHDGNALWQAPRPNDQVNGHSNGLDRIQDVMQQAITQGNSRMSPYSHRATRQHEDHMAQTSAALEVHQEEQRRVQHLQNAVVAAAGDPIARQMESSTPTAMSNGLAGQLGPGMERKGPVEFNHAISYVNKIKNRFSSQPEIYKQFLEILQTYQRESKPIQDVYAQVTQLFNGAPDLLEDFKQFLPESAAQAKEAAARQAAEDATMPSNLREGPSSSQTHHNHQTPRAEGHRMPPLGTFAPTPSAGRDGKRKRGDRHTQANGMMPGGPDFGGAANSKTAFQPHKRGKQSHQPTHAVKYPGPPPQEAPPVSPTLVPALPTPMAPNASTVPNSDELAFFDRVKKYLGNKNTHTEFLKLCNLFSQDLIDKNLLVFRAQSFIGGNVELFNWFKNFVNYDGKDHTIENAARASTGRVNLNNCRSLGQSYREMPKRERMKPCSGRDEMCKRVLNDQWVSHPTWASEESGFLAHKKNTYEEALHKIEEERHDYDQHVATVERTLQVLQPLADRNAIMALEDREAWRLEPEFGGQAEPIVRKVVGKVYTREIGLKIMDIIQSRPSDAIPVVIMRIKQRAEEWKAAQREWEKVWREQTQKMFWKSLDHMGINARANDKRQFQAKTLQNEIQVRFEEQKAQRLAGYKNVPSVQGIYSFSDQDVLVDGAKLLLTYADQNHATDMPRLLPFIKEFIPAFFGMDVAGFHERIDADFDATAAPEEDADVEMQDAEESAPPRGRKLHGKKRGLIRDVFRSRSGMQARGDKDGSTGPGSRASTPDVTSTAEEEVNSAAEEGSIEDPKPETWVDHSESGNIFKTKDIKPNEPFKREVFNLYANTPIYCFFRLLCILYERLEKLKLNEPQVHEQVRRAKAAKAAIDLRMIDKHPDNFFTDTSINANYYKQILVILEEFAKGEGEMSNIEEVLRRYYLRNGWMLYSFDKMLGALVRFGINILNNDGKDKSSDIVNLFQKDRKKELTTHADELAYRKAIESRIKEGDIYRIAFNQQLKNATIRILKRDDDNFSDTEDGLTDPKDRWRLYVASYIQPSPTEGIPPSSISPTSLPRTLKRTADTPTLPSTTADDAAPSDAQPSISEPPKSKPNRYDAVAASENLQIRISTDDYRLKFNVPLDPAVKREREGARKQFWPLPEVRDEEWWVVLPSGTPALSRVASKTSSHGEKGAGVAAEGAADAGQDGEAGKDEEMGGDEQQQEEDAEHEHDVEGEDDTPDHKIRTRFVMNNSWMRGLSREDVDAKNGGFRGWREGVDAAE